MFILKRRVPFLVALISTVLASYYDWFSNLTPVITRIHDVYSCFSFSRSFPRMTNPSTPPINCTSPPPRTCTFYSDCLEPQFRCGPKGYPLGFGEKFCLKFSEPENVERLSTKGQEWMWKTMECLQRALVPELDILVLTTTVTPDLNSHPSLESGSTERVCKALEEKAFSTHAPCYLSSGLCSLPPEDWIVIVQIIDIQTLLSSWDAFAGGVKAGEGCLEFFERALAKGLA